MRLCVLLASYEGSTSPFQDLDPPYDPRPFLPDDEVHVAPLRQGEAATRIPQLVATGFDAFINLCDGMADEDIAGVEVVQTLEGLGVPFTGPDSTFCALDKATTKRVARALGIPTPDEVFAFDGDDIARAAASLRFPLIVKHFNGYASVGMTPRSRVADGLALTAEAERVIRACGGALIEEFVDGREVTVLVIEEVADPASPRVYPPLELLFPPGETFKHADLKWRTYGSLTHAPLDEGPLADELRRLTASLFLGLGGNGFARLDYRIDRAGRPFLLDVNPLCGVFYPPGAEGCADLILRREPEGHRRFLELLLQGAFARRRRPGHRHDRPGPDSATVGEEAEIE